MTSKDIYCFTPTYLYIKRHSVTGKLYFGKTTRKDPEKYLGSGTHWKRHIDKHGKEHVETIWYCLFLDQESCTEFAMSFSRQNNIAESEDWLNLKPENGLDGGGTFGLVLTDTHKKNISKSRRGKYHSDETRQRMSIVKLGIQHSDDRRKRISEAMNGLKYSIVECPICGKSGAINAMKRWHFDRCRQQKNYVV